MADTSADAPPANGHASTPNPPPSTATTTGKTTSEMPPPKLASTATTSMAITIDPSRASALHSALSSVLTRIQTASLQRQPQPPPPPSSLRSSRPLPRLVAVSKLKPASDILALHQPLPPSATTPTTTTTTTTTPGQIHFGENYAQELIEKSRLLPRSIKWHMIGGLQSNKCRELARQVRNLWAVESVDSVKKAGLLEKGRAELLSSSSQEGEEEKIETEKEEDKLRVFVQVNTSGEASKAGVAPEGAELVQLCRYVREQCPHLQLQGLMTIGAIARSQQAVGPEAENEDFECLKKARERVVRELGLEEDELELSMGMSEDFEAAIAQGSDEVRIGTTIFGTRPPKSEAKVVVGV